MFTKQSRYYMQPDVLAQDAAGQTHQSKGLRFLPTAPGRHQHTVEANDRLDHLAYKYYQRPRLWWRICDANPAHLSPLALLGKEPLNRSGFRLIWNENDGQPPWSALCSDLSNRPGVEVVEVRDERQLDFDVRAVGEELVSIATSRPDRSILVIYNTLLIDAFELMDAIMAHGFQQVQVEEETRVGKPVTIPPANMRAR